MRGQLDRWESRQGRDVRLQAFSCHVDISVELPREERGRDRTIQKLALLLAHLLPVPVIVAKAPLHRSTARARLVVAGYALDPWEHNQPVTFGEKGHPLIHVTDACDLFSMT